MAAERVQKILAQAGIASRRKAEELIVEGLVTINGQIAKLGDKAELGKDAIKVKGKLLQAAEAPIYLAFYKPRGVISALTDPEGRPAMADYLGKIKSRVYPIGRLDFTSEGLLLLTNDGALAAELQKRDDIPRVYHVKVKGHPDAEMISRLERGIRLENGRYFKPHSVKVVQEFNQKASVEVVVLGAGAVDIRAFLESRGFLVDRMVRSAFGHITLKGLEPGAYRMLTASQAQSLLEQPELGLKRLEEEHEKLDEKAARAEAHEERREKLKGRRRIVRPDGPGRDESVEEGRAPARRIRVTPASGEVKRERGGFEKRGGFGKRDGFEKRGGFGKRDGFEKRGGFGKREGSEERGGFGKREGSEERGGFGKREGFEKRGGFGKRAGSEERGGFKPRGAGFGAGRGGESRGEGRGAGFGAGRGAGRDGKPRASGFGKPRTGGGPKRGGRGPVRGKRF